MNGSKRWVGVRLDRRRGRHLGEDRRGRTAPSAASSCRCHAQDITGKFSMRSSVVDTTFEEMR